MSQSMCRLLPHGASRPQMIEPGVLGLGLFQEREVGVGVFPGIEECLIPLRPRRRWRKEG